MVYPPIDQFARRCEIVRVVDGDTIEMRIDLGFATWVTEMVRLAGVDTPEMRGPEAEAGQWVTKQVIEHIGDCRECWIHSQRFRVDSFRRVIADVWIGGHSLNTWLVQKGYGWPTDHDGKALDGRSIEALALPEGIKQRVREAMA